MLRNELNSAEKAEIGLSPLQNSQNGRFSRKGEKRAAKVFDRDWADTILAVLFISFLIMTDFILFAGSGNIQVFNNSILPTPEVSIVLISIISITLVLMSFCNKYRKLKHIISAAIAFIFVYVVFNQFSQYFYQVIVGSYIVPVYIIIGFGLAILTFMIFEQEKILYGILYVVSSFVLFLHVYTSYLDNVGSYDFVESYNIQTENKEPGKKLIYLIFPNLSSYSYLATFHTSEAEEVRHITQGFWQKNNFKIYSKAYTPNEDYINNMTDILNPITNNSGKNNILDTKMLYEYWRFYNLRNEFVYLKNNELYDVFHHNNFRISAYKSRDFDMCRKNHKYNVDRCVEKVNRPANLYDMHVSSFSKAGILTIDWISSMKLFDVLMSSIYRFLAPFMDTDKMPMIGTNYNNLYVVNSIKTFDILLDDIKNDSGNQAYFAFIDIPSDMYIYDEYCKITPQNQWFNRSNLPWITRDYTSQRRDAYLKQTKCLFGKMENFIEKLKQNDLWSNTVMVVLGISGVNNFQNHQIDDVSEDFIANRLVTMAVHDNNMNEYSNDNRFCAITDLSVEYLFGMQKCVDHTFNIHENILENISNKINYLLGDINYNYIDNFTQWYNKWLSFNMEDQTDDSVLVDIQSRNDLNDKIPDLAEANYEHDNIKLNSNVFESTE